MKATKVRLVQMVEGRLVPSELAIENIIPAMEVRGFKAVGVKRQVGAIALREEILGQPIFGDLAGPMYDGPGIVRYEDLKANDLLSR